MLKTIFIRPDYNAITIGILTFCNCTSFAKALPGKIPTSDKAQKVATARKTKSPQETTPPQPNCNSDGKADNKRQALINTDTRRFKIQMGNIAPPPRQDLLTSKLCMMVLTPTHFTTIRDGHKRCGRTNLN